MEEKCLTPRAQACHDRFLEAAFSVFLEQGFEKTSMNDIVKRSGGSLSTIYKIFGNKAGLFAAALEMMTESVYKEFETLAKDKNDGSIEAFLYAFGLKALEVVHSDQSVLLKRMAMAEGHKNGGELGRIFFRHGLGKALAVLSDYIAAKQRSGEFRSIDAEKAAIWFFQMVKEPHSFRLLIAGEKPELSDDGKERIVREAVNFFLHGILTR